MTLHSQNEFSIPEETIPVARAVYPKGHLYTKMRDTLGILYQDESFTHIFPHNGRPAESLKLTMPPFTAHSALRQTLLLTALFPLSRVYRDSYLPCWSFHPFPFPTPNHRGHSPQQYHTFLAPK